MGQYYKPVLLNKNNEDLDIVFTIHSWHCDGNGAKLMEHSYLNNSVVNATLNKIKELGGARLVWAGDYANNVKSENGKLVWCSDEDSENKNLYELAGDIFPCDEDGEYDWYNKENPGICCILNETKKLYISVYDIPKIGYMTVHPLPLLCADGNGRGGGDYRDGLNMGLIGSWKGDLISVTEDYPFKVENRGYRKFDSVFAEREDVLTFINLAEDVKKLALEQVVISDEDLKK